MNETIFEHLKKIIADVMPDTDLTGVEESTLLKNDLGIDSIETMMIAIVIEDDYGFKFDDSINLETVGDICDYIESKTKQTKTGGK